MVRLRWWQTAVDFATPLLLLFTELSIHDSRFSQNSTERRGHVSRGVGSSLLKTPRVTEARLSCCQPENGAFPQPFPSFFLHKKIVRSVCFLYTRMCGGRPRGVANYLYKLTDVASLRVQNYYGLHKYWQDQSNLYFVIEYRRPPASVLLNCRVYRPTSGLQTRLCLPTL